MGCYTCQTYIKCFKTNDKRIGQSSNLSFLLNMQCFDKGTVSRAKGNKEACKRQNKVFPCKEHRGLAKGKVLTKGQQYLQKANKKR